MPIPLEEVLSRLPIQGGCIIGGTAAYANYLPILNSSGQLDPSLFANTVLAIHKPATYVAMVASTANIGDIAIEQDNGSIYMYSAVSTWTIIGITGSVPFTNTHTSFTATNVQDAINELWDKTLATNVARTATALVTFNHSGAPFAVGSSTVVTGLNADQLDGEEGSWYQNVANLTTGSGASRIDPSLVAGQTYTINVVGNLTGTASVAATATTATTSLACSGNAASADTSAACTGNSATATLATNSTNLQAADSSYQPGSYFQNPAHLTGGKIPNAVFDATSHGILSDSTLHAIATDSTAGFMSAADKAKLDTVEASASISADSFGSVIVSGSTTLAAETASDSLYFVSDSPSLLAITTATTSGKEVHFDVTISGLLHSALGHLTDSTHLLYDDHPQYMAVAVNRTVVAQHTFSPGSAGPPFYLGVNSQDPSTNLVSYLNAEYLNSNDSAYYLNATNINAGTLNTSRLTGTYTIGINGLASLNVPLTGNSTIIGDLTAGNFIDVALVGSGNRFVYTSATGEILTDPTIIAGILGTGINNIIAGGTDLTTSYLSSTLTLNVASATAATANKLVKRDSSGNATVAILNATSLILPSNDGHTYQVTLQGTPGAWYINPTPVT